jgi:hypothetical protein
VATDPLDLVPELAAPVERVFAEIGALSDALARQVAACAADDRPVTTADLHGLRAVADAILGGDGLPVGAGVVLDPGFLADAERYLEWRQRGRDGRPRPLVLDVDPGSEDPYDYPEMEWFRVPHDEGRRMVGGPYFDFRGAERCALTFAVPVSVDGRFVGVAGADIPLSQLEAELLPVLRRIPQRAALVNHESRVVTANTPHLATGSRVRPESLAGPVTVVDVVVDLPWRLLVMAGM